MLPPVDTTIATGRHLDKTGGPPGAVHLPSVHDVVASRRKTNSFHLISFEGGHVAVVKPAIDNSVLIYIVFRSESAIYLYVQPLVCATVTVRIMAQLCKPTCSLVDYRLHRRGTRSEFIHENLTAG